MKILHLGPIPPEAGGLTEGGVATAVWGLSTQLAKRGHKVAVLADNFPNPPEVPIVKEGVEVYGISKVLILKHLPSVLPSLSIVVKLRQRLKGLMGIKSVIATLCYYDYVFHHFNPEIVHVQRLESRFPFAYFIAKGKVPLVTTVGTFNSIKLSTPSLSKRYYRLVADNLKLAKNLIFPSRLVEKECGELFGDYNAKSWVIHNPVDTTKYYPIGKDEARRRLSLPPDIPLLLFVGHLIKIKGIYVLLEATKILKEKGKELKVVIVGDGAERNGVEDFVVGNALQDIVRMEGTKQYPELLYYYNAADLLVMPSFAIGIGLAYVEAFACGIPVIVCKGMGDEAIRDSKCGMLVPPGDPSALEKAVEGALSQRWDRNDILACAKSFSWDTNIHKFEEMYTEVLGSA